MREIAEKDWKYFSSLKVVFLNRFAEETLSKISKIIASKDIESKHEKYIKIYRYVEKRDKILADDLSDFRRSNAKLKILVIYRMGLIEPEEFNQFSEDVKDFVRKCNEL